MKAGFNTFILPQSYLVTKGQFVYVTQSIGVIAVDQSGNATYSDLVWQTSIWSKLTEFSNWRIFFNTLSNFTTYQSSFNLVHSYSSIGLYTLSILIRSSNQLFQKQVNITDCKFYIILKLL